MFQDVSQIMSFNNNSGYKLMEDFNDTEQDWFYDIDEPGKQTVLNHDSPGDIRAESELADFSALNVPVDDNFFAEDLAGFSGGDQQIFTASDESATFQSRQQIPQKPPGLHSQYENIQPYDPGSTANNNVNHNGQINDVSFHQPFQQTTIVPHQLSTTNAPLNATDFDYSASRSTVESNFVECQPSTSNSQVVTTHSMSSQQMQQYKDYTTVSSHVIQQVQNQQQWVHQIPQTLSVGNTHQSQPDLQSLQSFGMSVQQSAAQVQQLQSTNQEIPHHYFHNSQQTYAQSGLSLNSQTSTIMTVDQSMLQQQQTIVNHQPKKFQTVIPQSQQKQQQFSTEMSYRIIQPESGGIQQVTYINQDQVPFITTGQKSSDGHLQVFQAPIDGSLPSIVSGGNDGFNVILQPQQTSIISQQQQQSQTALFSNASLEQQPIILSQNPHICNVPQQSQQFFNTSTSAPLNHQSQISDASSDVFFPILTKPAETKKAPRSGRRQSKQSGLGGNFSGSMMGGDGPVNTLGAVMQKIYATTGDMNAAVRFTPDMAVEFSKMASQLNELKEQQEFTSVNLSDEIKAVEDRIVKLLSVAEPTTQTPATGVSNCDRNGQSVILHEPVYNLSNTTLTSTANAKPLSMPTRGKGRRKPNVSARQSIISSANISSTSSNGISLNENLFQQSVGSAQPSISTGMILHSSNMPAQQNQMMNNNVATSIVLSDSQQILTTSQTQPQQTMSSQPYQQHSIFVGSQQTSNSQTMQTLQILPAPQYQQPKSTNFGISKRGQISAAKFQQLQQQQQKLAVVQPQTTQPQAVAILEMHPQSLGSQLTPQQLSQIISAANLNTNSPTTIIVDYNGQKLVLVVQATITPGASNSSINVEQQNVVPSLMSNSNSATQRLPSSAPSFQSNNSQSGISLSFQGGSFDSSQGSFVETLPNFNASSTSFKNLRTKRGNTRAVLSTANSVLPIAAVSSSGALTSTPSQSTSLDLDDTIERVVCQQAFLAAANSSKLNTDRLIMQPTKIGAVLQYSKPQSRRKPRAKNLYNDLTPSKPLINVTTILPVAPVKKPTLPTPPPPPPPPPPLCLPSPIELGKKIAEKKAERKLRLSNKFESLRNSLDATNYDLPFSSKTDCLNRLLPFALCYEPDLNDDFFEQYDHEFLRHSIGIRERQTNIESKIRKILYKDSMEDSAFNQEVNMLLYLDNEYERRELEKVKFQSHCDEFITDFPLLNSDRSLQSESCTTNLNTEPASKRVMDFEYHDFDSYKYLNISPYVSPLPPTLPIVYASSSEEEYLTETDESYTATNSVASVRFPDPLSPAVFSAVVKSHRDSEITCMSLINSTKESVSPRSKLKETLRSECRDATDSKVLLTDSTLPITASIPIEPIKKNDVQDLPLNNNNAIENVAKTPYNIQCNSNSLNVMEEKINDNNFIEPIVRNTVKLKIKLGSIKDETDLIFEYNNDEDERCRKEEKRRRKDEKRERKKLKKLLKLKNQNISPNEGIEFDVRQKSEDNFEFAPLINNDIGVNESLDEEISSKTGINMKTIMHKISEVNSVSNLASRQPCWRDANSLTSTDNTFANESKTRIVNDLSENNNAGNPINDGMKFSLKLRIPKLLLSSNGFDDYENDSNNKFFERHCDKANNLLDENVNNVVKNEMDKNTLSNKPTKSKPEKRHKTHRKRKLDNSDSSGIQCKLIASEPTLKLPSLKIRFSKFGSENFLTNENFSGNPDTFVISNSSNSDVNKVKECHRSSSSSQNYSKDEMGSKRRRCHRQHSTKEQIGETVKFALPVIKNTFDKELEVTNECLISDKMSSVNKNSDFFQCQHEQYSDDDYGKNNCSTFNLMPNENLSGKVVRRVQFSPCSEDSDDDRLRSRTNQLLTKLINKEQSRV